MTKRTVLAAMVLAAGWMMGWGGATPARAAETYQVDPVHSMFIFKIQRFGLSNFYGRFHSPTGTFRIDRENPANSTFTIEVPAANVDTANQRRDDHLRSPDFFNARQFPVIRFASTEVKASEAGDNVYEVTGDLTMHGVTRPVTAHVEIIGEGAGARGRQLMGVEARFTLQRSDFGITFMADQLGDEVEVVASLEAIRQ